MALSQAVTLLFTRHITPTKRIAGIAANSHTGLKKWKSCIMLAGIRISIKYFCSLKAVFVFQLSHRVLFLH